MKALSEIHEIVRTLKEKGGHPNAHISISINRRLRTTMGRAKVKRGAMSVEFNPRLFARATDQEQYETIVHEVAHIFDYIENGRMRGHGADWKNIMRRLGSVPDRCHSVDVTGIRVRQRRINVECPARCGWVTRMAQSTHTKWRKKLASGRVTARCPMCKTRLRAEHFRTTTITIQYGRGGL